MKVILRLLETIIIVPIIWTAHVLTTLLVLLIDLIMMFATYYRGSINLNSTYNEIKESIKP